MARTLGYGTTCPELIRDRTPYLLIFSLLLLSSGVVGQACSIDLGSDSTICQGQTVTITAPPGYPNYAWSTGSNATSITVGNTGTYWGEVSYSTGELVTNGNFSGGNTGFSTQFNYNSTLVNDGNYWIGTNAATYHNQFLGTGNGAFLMVNAGWMHAGWQAWCETINVCPGQTYTLRLRAMSLAAQGSPLLDWAVDGVQQGLWMQTGSQASWSTFTNTWTVPAGQTSATFCVVIASGHGVGNDLGLDDVSISSTIVLRDEVDVTVTPLPVVDLGPDATLCVGQNLVLDAGVAGGTYLWQDGATTSTYVVSGPGNYSVTVTANNCSASDAINVNYNALPMVNLGPDLTLCTGNGTTLNANIPGGSYVWQDGSTNPTFAVTGPGTYSVTVTRNNCPASDAVDIAYNPTPVVNIGPDQVICEGAQVTLDATTPGATYAWQDGSTSPTFNANATGSYSATVTVNGCPATDAMDLTVTPLPVFDLGPDQTICPGGSVLLDATIPGGSYVWQDGSMAATFNASSPGLYSVTVTANNCPASDSFTLSNFSLQTVDLGADFAICQGTSTSIGNAVPGATYLWSTGAATPSISVSTAGTYWQDVILNGCTVRDSVVVSVTSLPVFDLGADVNVCPGIQAALDATTIGATYLWNTGSVSPTINVGPGAYDVTVTANGCSTNDAITVGAWPAAAVNLGADVSLCPGSQIVLDATQVGASYLWQDGSVGPTFTASIAGNYNVVLTDANSCIATDAIAVSFAAPSTISLGADTTICQGSSLALDATVPGATYLWNTGAITPTISATAAGTYSVVVTQGSCSVNDAIDVQVAAQPTVNLGPDVNLCPGEQVVLDATGLGLTYAWNTGAITPTITVTTGGAYSVIVTNAAQCTASDPVSVSFAAPGSVNLGPDISLCQGASATLDATLPGATYLWSTGAVTPTLIVNANGTYSVVLTQGNCTVSDAVDVQVDPMPSLALGSDVTLCAGEDVVLDATFPGATYLWNTGAITPTITAAATGTYSVDVILNNCVASDAIDVTVLSATSLDLGPDVTICDGEQIVLDATTAGATYLWSTGAVTPTLTVTTTGNYSVEVFSGNCSVTDAITVTVDPIPIVALGSDATLCAGEVIVLDATYPGATYLWNTGAITPTITAAATGTYSVDVTLNNCVASDVIDVTVLSATSLDLGSDVVICDGEQMVLDATTPGATYLWSTGAVSSTLQVSTAGVYSVEVFVGNCSVTDAITISVNPTPTVDLGADQVYCDGETQTMLDASWPLATYAWENGSITPTRTVSASGTYSVEVDLGGCTGSDEITVTFGSLTYDLGPDTTLCPGEIVVLGNSASNGTTMWNGTIVAPTLTVNVPGVYTVEFTGGTGCNAVDTIIVDYATPGTIDLGPDATICAGGTVALDATLPNATYLWNDGLVAATRTVTTSGIYAVQTFVDECVVSDEISITVVPLPVVDIGPDVELCPEGTATFNATTPNATYLWQNGSTAATYSNGNAGGVSVTVTVDGCSASDAAMIMLIDGPSVELGADTVLCEGASVAFDVDVVDGAFLWEDGSTSAIRVVDAEGMIWVEVTRNSCTVRDSLQVHVFSPDALDLGPDQLICAGASTELDATVPSATYLWSNGATTSMISVSDPGDYAVSVSLSGCVAEDQIIVEVLNLQRPDLGPDLTLCEGSSAELVVASNGANVLWSTGEEGASIQVSAAGVYIVTLDSLGCTTSDAVQVSMIQPITDVDLGPDQSLCAGAFLTIEASMIPGATYAWNTGATGVLLSVDRPGTYTVTATGACINATASVVIEADDCGTYVHVPNAFTPNNDGINDVFLPAVAGPVDRFQLDIFDRWGERIHSTENRNSGWDGSYADVPSQDGVYIWTLTYRVLGPQGVKSERLTGHVTLLR